jgi:NAD(P)-dependent dehydrogenase (short-subunit alcohol dehydrogenase family)
LITGPSEGGIGAETALTLAVGSPKLIILAGRSLSKIKPVIDNINSAHPNVATTYIPLDLGSQASVRQAATAISASVEKIDIVINNAAIMACPFSKTEDGIESQFGTNYIGHFLLTNLLMEKILAAGHGSRIVNVSSSAHRMADVRIDDWNFEVNPIYHTIKSEKRIQ